ncbi:MAG: hypothetical protein WCC57_13795, partial [Paracoccaceae bacterium]
MFHGTPLLSLFLCQNTPAGGSNVQHRTLRGEYLNKEKTGGGVIPRPLVLVLPGLDQFVVGD